MRRAVMLVAVLILGGCAFAIVGEDRFRAEAFRREGAFAVNYQALFRCFSATVPQGNTALMGMGQTPSTTQLYPDLGFGEYRWAGAHGARSGFLALIEFRKAGPFETKVTAWQVSKASLDDDWAKIAACVP